MNPHLDFHRNILKYNISVSSSKMFKNTGVILILKSLFLVREPKFLNFKLYETAFIYSSEIRHLKFPIKHPVIFGVLFPFSLLFILRSNIISQDSRNTPSFFHGAFLFYVACKCLVTMTFLTKDWIIYKDGLFDILLKTERKIYFTITVLFLYDLVVYLDTAVTT